jgi:hypothetical protein
MLRHISGASRTGDVLNVLKQGATGTKKIRSPCTAEQSVLLLIRLPSVGMFHRRKVAGKNLPETRRTKACAPWHRSHTKCIASGEKCIASGATCIVSGANCILGGIVVLMNRAEFTVTSTEPENCEK